MYMYVHIYVYIYICICMCVYMYIYRSVTPYLFMCLVVRQTRLRMSGMLELPTEGHHGRQ